MSFVTLAERLISSNGRVMTLRSIVKSGTAYNPTITNVDMLVTGVMTEYKLSEVGDIVQVGDKSVLLAASATPKAEDKLIDGSLVYEIVNVTEIKPGNDSIMFKIQVRS